MNKNITDSIVESSTGWDEGGEHGDILLFDATLATDTPKHKKGDKVATIAFIFSQSICEIYDEAGAVTDTFNIKLSIV